MIIIIFIFYRDYHKKQDHLKLLREKVSLFFIVVIPFVFVTCWYQMLFLENVICHKNNTLQNSNFKLKESLRYIIFLSLLSGIKQESR